MSKRRAPKAARRTIAFFREWATEKADAIEARAAETEFPALALAVGYTSAAFEQAAQIALWAYADDALELPAFALAFAELRECRYRAKPFHEGPRRPEVWPYWADTPTPYYDHWTGENALDAAYQFAVTIHGETFCNLRASWNVPATAIDIPAVTRWPKDAIAGIRKLLLLPSEGWSVPKLHGQTRRLRVQLRHEYRQAMEKARASAKCSGS